MLDEDARLALAAYELVGRSLNEQLRAGLLPPLAKALDRAFEFAPTTQSPWVAWRGSRELLGIESVPLVRRELGFLSLTTAEATARFFAGPSGTVFEVAIPAGVPYILVRDHIAAEYPLERELVLPRGLVLSIEDMDERSGVLFAAARIGLA